MRVFVCICDKFCDNLITYMLLILCHCIYRCITLFVKRIEPSITGVSLSKRAIIIIIIIIILGLSVDL